MCEGIQWWGFKGTGWVEGNAGVKTSLDTKTQYMPPCNKGPEDPEPPLPEPVTETEDLGPPTLVEPYNGPEPITELLPRGPTGGPRFIAGNDEHADAGRGGRRLLRSH